MHKTDNSIRDQLNLRKSAKSAGHIKSFPQISQIDAENLDNENKISGNQRNPREIKAPVNKIEKSKIL